MDENPYKAPAEKGLVRPRLSARSKFHAALFITLGVLIGVGCAAMVLFDMNWWFNSLILVGVAIGVISGYLIPPLKKHNESDPNIPT